MSSKNLSKNQKRPKFFWFFALLQVRVPSKKPKKPWVFLVFSRSWPKKTKKLEENQKKPNMSLRPNILWKVLVFWFFGFLVLSRFFGFPHGLFPKEKSNSWLVPLNLEKNQKTKKPKLFRECLVWGSCFFLFWFSSSFFVFFCHDLEKTKKTQGFFGFLDQLMVKELWKTKKTQVFFVFMHGLLLHVF